MDLVRRRKLVNAFALSMSMLAVAFGLFWLFWILVDVFQLGIGAVA